MKDAKSVPLILCVDDYENILDGWKMLLEGEGYRVLTAADAIGAIELFLSHSVDEVILDYQMPGITGDALASQMKAVKPNVPILMVSGDGRLTEEKLKTVDSSLRKADSISIFLERVEALLDPLAFALDKPPSSSHNDSTLVATSTRAHSHAA